MMERLLKSRYKIQDRISEGPFSITYKGSLLDKDAPLIIKIYKRSVLSSSLIKVVKRKVRDLCGINHQNIARVIDGDYGWQGFYFVREYVEGRTLREYLHSQPRLDVEDVLKIIFGVCEGLKAAHDKGIIHGALGPNNVIIDSNGTPKIADLIIVGEMRESVRERAEMALSSSAQLSPEEVMGDIPTAASDVYAAGLLVYIMLTGKNPFEGATGVQTSLNILRLYPEALKNVRGDVPEYLDAVVTRALDKDPLMRFRNINGFISSLKAKAVIDEPIRKIELPDISLENLIENAEVVGEPERGGKEEARPNFLLLLVVIMVAAAFGIGYAFFSGLLSK